MKYENIVRGTFIERPNRFIARVLTDTPTGKKEETVHVKNTGRCRELLIPGAQVFLEKSQNPDRKTAYDLVAVYKDSKLVNMDSNAPNKAVSEWIEESGYFENVTKVRAETVFGDSRFDFYVEAGEKKIFLEVKGVTLEHQNTALFPDAPSERAVKHVEELIDAVRQGYECYVFFVIQMKGVTLFRPNWETHAAFAESLLKAQQSGVNILAYDCQVWEHGMKLDQQIPVLLAKQEDVLECIATPLLKWYDEHRRILPWREDPSPYHVWLSEIMLQQTRVEAVKPYFERFISELPDIAALAAVEEDRLLKLWEGLGYYNRARNLKRAAQQIMEEYDGKMPSDYEQLLGLKGIGSYTAGAVASIAFGQPRPAVDGNVLRVMARLLKDEGDILAPAVKKRIEDILLTVMPKNRPGDFNQALMELGAMICVPNGAPKCMSCPWQELCAANRDRSWTDYPKKSAKKPRIIEKRTILVIKDDTLVAIRKRPEKGLLAGLYEFPSIEGHAEPEEILQYIKKLGISAVRVMPLPDAKHIFTHKEWHMKGFLILTDELETMRQDKKLLFVEPKETESLYPIPSAFAVYTKYLNIRTGSEQIRAYTDREKEQILT